MAGLRKFTCYRTTKRAYTRKSKFKKKGYIKAAPNNRIVKFDMGNAQKSFAYQTSLNSNQRMQIRQNAIESARLIVNRKLDEKLGNNYHLQIRIYPHHVLRENKMLTGAGADRMQTGMQLSFGKAIGLAAQLKKNQTILAVFSDEKDVETIKEILKTAIPKLPCKCTIETHKIL